jgi:hypothetical protein
VLLPLQDLEPTFRSCDPPIPALTDEDRHAPFTVPVLVSTVDQVDPSPESSSSFAIRQPEHRSHGPGLCAGSRRSSQSTTFGSSVIRPGSQ